MSLPPMSRDAMRNLKDKKEEEHRIKLVDVVVAIIYNEAVKIAETTTFTSFKYEIPLNEKRSLEHMQPTCGPAPIMTEKKTVRFQKDYQVPQFDPKMKSKKTVLFQKDYQVPSSPFNVMRNIIQIGRAHV